MVLNVCAPVQVLVLARLIPSVPVVVIVPPVRVASVATLVTVPEPPPPIQVPLIAKQPDVPAPVTRLMPPRPVKVEVPVPRLMPLPATFPMENLEPGVVEEMPTLFPVEPPMMVREGRVEEAKTALEDVPI